MTALPLLRPPQHLLSVVDLGVDGIEDVVEHALEIKSRPPLTSAAAPLAGRAVALVFDRPSLRTRVSFEVGVQRLGGLTTTLAGKDIGLGSREPLTDIAATLSRYVDAIVVRMVSHAALAELAAAANVPVVNALTEHEHPCQALADLLTLREHLGPLRGRQLVFVGDGNNVCHSLLLAGAAVGLNVRVAAPAGYEPDADIVAGARAIARQTGARIEIGNDPAEAVVAADALYTDVWASIGDEDHLTTRRRDLAGFRISRELLRAAPQALVMHCLPAHRGEEIEADVIDGPRSVVFDQAENRLYVQQAVLLRLLRYRAAYSRPPLATRPAGIVGPIAAVPR
ncbi:MAG: ornithine carbamoyltransferase [Chloroflexota bacterium]|nr:ornithine carbamoyltransferase [Chloroflexota bacterium]